MLANAARKTTLLLSASVMAGLLSPGCQKRREPDAPPRSVLPSQDAPPPAPRGDPRFQCTRDADCRPTCALGAVARTWWRQFGRPYARCEGGCAAKGYFVRCVHKVCVTFQRGHGAPRRVDHCTFRPLPLPRPRPPAHRGAP